MDCIFCRIAHHEKPEIVHYEDDQVISFNDIHPKAPVHILVVTKEHIASIAHLQANHAIVISKLIYAAREVAATHGLSGYKLIFNVGRDGGQVIDHLHLHLLGGWGESEDWKKRFQV